MTKAEQRQQTEARAQEVCALLLRFPALRRSEAARFLGLTQLQVKNHLEFGRSALRLMDEYHPVDQPDADEWRWRFEHQSAQELRARFGANVVQVIEKAGMAAAVPSGLRLELARATGKRMALAVPQEPAEPEPPAEDMDSWFVEPVQEGSRMCRIRETDVVIKTESASEMRLVSQVVQGFRQRYEMNEGDWQIVRPFIDQRLDMERLLARTDASQRDAKFLKDLADLNDKLVGTFSRLKFKEKEPEGEFPVIQRAITRARELLALRGYRQAFACRTCGQVERVYLPIYRRNVEFDATMRARGEPQTKCPRCREVWGIYSRAVEDPIFRAELRELGLAWGKDLVDWGLRLVERYGVPLEEVQDGLAALLEISPVALDANNPYSALSRVREGEDGRLAVVNPEE